MSAFYKPPYTVSSEVLADLVTIGELMGRYSAVSESEATPILRRGNRIQTIQASLEIENNTLTLDQVTAIIEGKRVLGSSQEIQEVQNAFVAYEDLLSYKSSSRKDFLRAHGLLTDQLVSESGKYRTKGVGIFQGKKLIHMAPPAENVRGLMNDLFTWLQKSDEHPLIKSTVFHYECEVIHPFADGNGRMGRLWQTLILTEWNPLWAYIPVETVVRDLQDEYYRVLGESDKTGDATPFIRFMIAALKKSLADTLESVTHQKSALTKEQEELVAFCNIERSIIELMEFTGRKDRSKFRKALLNPLLNSGHIKMTIPEKPKSPKQRYVASLDYS